MAEPTPQVLALDADAARRILLARAIDEVDTDGTLIGAAERDPIERQALQATTPDAGAARPAAAPDPARYLDARARGMLDLLARRDPATSALQQSETWQRRLAWLLPLGALVLGASLERIDNPQQVNMLSPPLLAFIAWNLAVYVAVAVFAFRRPDARTAGAPSWLDWLSQPRGRSVQAQVAARFHLHWWRLAGSLERQRLAQVLHASAAAWAVGVGLSIVVGGLVREYRIGWESTLLDLRQVHALLHALFAPVVALLPLDSFSLADLERMHFRSGADVGQAEARHWIALYLGLLLLVVVIPRVLLATWSGLRRAWLGRSLSVSLTDPYYEQVLARVSPAWVQVGWMASSDAARATLLRMWREACAHASEMPAAPGAPWEVLRGDRGDVLRAIEWVPEGAAAPQAGGGEPNARAVATANGWWERLRARTSAFAAADAPPAEHPTEAFRVLLVAVHDVAALEALFPLLRGVRRPLLLLHAGEAATREPLRAAASAMHLDAQWLDLPADAGCWAWEARLRDALARGLPDHQKPGMTRLSALWQARHATRFAESMDLLAAPLLHAARATEDVGGGPLSLRRLVNPDERDASHHAREEASRRLLGRLADTQGQCLVQLRRLHGLDPVDQPGLDPAVDTRLRLRDAVDAPQAGMAGAASGAAAGATIDLMTGGLTLGAAAALGALVGGASGFVAAAWKNRATPAGTPQIQLSDEMLQALCELALLHYLTVAIRTHRTGEAVPAAWRSEVVQAVQAQQAFLATQWRQARGGGQGVPAPTELARRLQEITRDVLSRVSPREAGS